jgi:hypothetical protein
MNPSVFLLGSTGDEFSSLMDVFPIGMIYDI